MRFEPAGERLLVEVRERESTTPTGIVIPDAAREAPQTAVVVEVGEFTRAKVGDEVVYMKYAGTEVKLNGRPYLVLDADDVLGVLREE